MTDTEKKLASALAAAAATLAAVYEWFDKVEANGGTTSLSGIATAHGFMLSLRKNRKRVEDLVVKPAKEALALINA